MVPSSSPLRVMLLCLLFFLSGAAGLIYEISWARQIGLLFGHTARAAAVVLFGYFCGLTFGYLLAGQLAPRLKRPLRWYGWVELLVAGWALLVPLLLAGISRSPVVPLIHHSSEWVREPARFLAASLILLPATIGLGATLPLLAEHLWRRGREESLRLPTIAYSANTAGAVVGVVLATFVFILWIGVTSSSYLAATISALVGVAAWLLSANEPVAVASVAEPHPTPSSHDSRPWLWLVAASGFGALVLEVAYTALFAMVLHNSVYTFGAILAVFLLGLAVGAFLAACLLERVVAERLARWCCLAAGVSIPVSLAVFWLVTRFDYVAPRGGLVVYATGVLGVVAAVVLVPSTLLGMLLPICWSALHRGNSRLGVAIGSPTAINSLAGALGALAASFVILPWLGLWGGFLVVAFLFVSLATRFGSWSRPARWGVAGAAGGVLLVAIFAPERGQIVEKHERVVRGWRSPYGWIDVVDNEKTGSRRLRQNIFYSMGSTGSFTDESRQGRIPLLLHPSPRKVLFLGLATGITASEGLRHPEIERLEVVELIPEVVEAAGYFAGSNGDLLENERVEVHVNDARHHLLLSDQTFDVIVSDLFVPWESQTGYLYTVEHYRSARARLAPGGLFCQWIALWQVSQREFEMIANSMAAVFPHVTLWWGNFDGRWPVIALVGSNDVIHLDAAGLDERLEHFRRDHVERDPLLRSSSSLADLFIGDWSFDAAGTLNTDEHPRVEFLAPIANATGRKLTERELLSYFRDTLCHLVQEGVKSTGRPFDFDARRRRQQILLESWSFESSGDSEGE
ncbi:Spermidine synthase [Planctomycetes bacterium Pan216]|uniref:Spermidine synthase n=1 Tax=Kolteria novifilia TaxID=2527975 RepID=A0A518B0Q7_9BACT|nr:Spermidine synthase [Planctomycetes bacterium Pan216]